MLPLRDHAPARTFPFITYLILGANILVFVLMFSMAPIELESFIETYALQPFEVTMGEAWYTLITSMFLHGGLGHIIGNMLFLHIFGDNLEDALGHLKYLAFYLFTGIGASIAQIITSPQSAIPVLGASGAIAGLMGGYLVLFPNHRIDILMPSLLGLYRATVPAYTMLLYWFVFQFFQGLGSLSIEGGGIAFFAHIGGFITGAIIVLLLRPLLRENYA